MLVYIFVVQGVTKKYSLEEIEDYAEKELGIDRSSFKLEDSGTAHKLEYRTYSTTGKVDGINSGLAVIVARHTESNISYLFYIYSDIRTYKSYSVAFEYWYTNI